MIGATRAAACRREVIVTQVQAASQAEAVSCRPAIRLGIGLECARIGLECAGLRSVSTSVIKLTALNFVTVTIPSSHHDHRPPWHGARDSDSDSDSALPAAGSQQLRVRLERDSLSHGNPADHAEVRRPLRQISQLGCGHRDGHWHGVRRVIGQPDCHCPPGPARSGVQVGVKVTGPGWSTSS